LLLYTTGHSKSIILFYHSILHIKQEEIILNTKDNLNNCHNTHVKLYPN